MPVNQNIDREQTRYDDARLNQMKETSAKQVDKLPGGPIPSWSTQGHASGLAGALNPASLPRPIPFSDLEAFASVGAELGNARRRFPPMASAHEGWAIIKEEVDELWNEVKRQPDVRDLSAMQKEAVQIAAMAIRFLIDVR